MLKNDILIRTLTGAVFIASILGAIYLNSQITITVFGLFLLMGLIEYANFFRQHDAVSLPSYLFTFSGCLLYFFISEIFLDFISVYFIFIILPLIFSYFLVEIWRNKENPLLNVGVGIFGLFYLVFPFVLMIILTQKTTFLNPILSGMFLLIWANDTFAFLSGKFFGKHPLFERISPKKTWEGVIGGLIFTLLFSLLISFFLDATQDHVFWVISAIIVVPGAVLGDLLESLFKRSLNIKDSGSILPGHGGILDRFDATLISVPFFFSWFMLYYY